MDRRTALKQMAMGGAVIATGSMVGRAGIAVDKTNHHVPAAVTTQAATSKSAWKPLVFNEHQNETVTILTELIIPATDTPGAKEAKVNEFIDLMLSKEDADTRRDYFRGLIWVDRKSNELFGADFKVVTPEQQNALLVTISSGKNTALEDQAGVEFFNTIKESTINGYYTSEIGLMQELRYSGNTYLTDFPGCTHPEHKN